MEGCVPIPFPQHTPEKDRNCPVTFKSVTVMKGKTEELFQNEEN